MVTIKKNSKHLFSSYVRHNKLNQFTILFLIPNILWKKILMKLKIDSLQEYVGKGIDPIHLPFLRYSIFYISNHSINFKIFDVVMSITTWGRIHYWIYLLNRKSLRNKIWAANTNSHKQYFLENILNDLEDWVLVPGPF